MKNRKIKTRIIVVFLALLLMSAGSVSAQAKLAYINSDEVLEKYKEAIDVKKQLAELESQWRDEAQKKEKEIKELNEQLESQSLLLSQERKTAKQQDIQALYTKYQQFLQEKWDPQQGEAVKKQLELIQPVYDKINLAIKKIGETDGYAYIFDVVQGNILYASEKQVNLTEALVEVLNKNLKVEEEENKAEENKEKDNEEEKDKEDGEEKGGVK